MVNHISYRKPWQFYTVFVLLIASQIAGCHRKEIRTPESIVAKSSTPAKGAVQLNKPKPKSSAATSSTAKTPVATTISWVPAIVLLPFESVQTELQLTAEQKNRFTEIDQKRIEAQENWVDAGEGTYRGQMAAKMIATGRQLSKQAAEVLDDKQRNRLARISIQVNGIGSLFDPYVADRLSLTDEQQAKLMAIRNKRNAEISKLKRPNISGPSEKDMIAKSEEIRAKIEKEVLSRLSEQQKREFEGLRKPRRPATLTTPDMVAKLNINDEQKAKLGAIQKNLKQQQSSLNETNRAEKMAAKALEAKTQELNAEANQQMLAALTDQQRQKFESIPLQPRRPIELLGPKIAAPLNLTDEQKTRFAEIAKTDLKDLEILAKEIHKHEASSNQRSKERREVRAKAEEELLAVLTVDQRLAFASLKGNAPNIRFRDLQASNSSPK
jgi:hypothetical protein